MIDISDRYISDRREGEGRRRSACDLQNEDPPYVCGGKKKRQSLKPISNFAMGATAPMDNLEI